MVTELDTEFLGEASGDWRCCFLIYLCEKLASLKMAHPVPPSHVLTQKREPGTV